MGSNEQDILLEAEDKVTTLKKFIGAWNKAADESESRATRQYCGGRACGLEVCLPLIKKLTEDIQEAEMKNLLEEID